MDDETRRNLAMFRFSIIGPLVACSASQTNFEEKYRELASQTYTAPNGKEITFKAGTIKKWHLEYRKAEAEQVGGGLQALMPKNRIDCGSSRALSEKQQERIREIKGEFPRISGQEIWNKMVKEGSLRAIDASVDSVQRYLKSIGLNGPAGPRKEHLAFEFEHSNDCWQCDTMDGPVLHVPEARRTYFISFLDDHGHKVVGVGAFWEDNAINMQHVLKEAIRVWGIPKRITMDNGGPYRNAQLTEICAELGIPAINLLPYSPEGKGKIERYHRDVQSGLLDCTHLDKCGSLEELNEAFKDFIYTKHDRHINRMTNETPHDRYMRDYGLFRFCDKEKLDVIFLHRDSRCLQNDNTIQFENIRFEVPPDYTLERNIRTRGKIRFRYDPLDKSELYLVDEEKKQILYTIKPVDLVANSRRKRKSHVDPSATI